MQQDVAYVRNLIRANARSNSKKGAAMNVQLQEFVDYARQYIPKFKIAFKDKSKFMKLLSVILFFLPSFMTRYTTTIGYTVYFPSETNLDKNPEGNLRVLAHEFVHMMDYKKYNILFSLGYIFPHIFAVFSLFALMAISFSNLWLLSLLMLLLALPLPAYFRMYFELRGYTMSAAFNVWTGSNFPKEDWLLSIFAGSSYYFMWPFKDNMKKRMVVMFDRIKDDSILQDQTFKAVHDFILTHKK